MYLIIYILYWKLTSDETDPRLLTNEFHKLKTNLLLESIYDDLIYDEETDQFLVKFVEIYKLETFLEDSIGKYIAIYHY